MRYDDTPKEPRDPREPVGVDDSPSRTAYVVAAVVLLAGAAAGVGAWLLVGRDEVPDGPAEAAEAQPMDQSSPMQAMPPEAVPAEEELIPTPAEQLREAQAKVENLETELTARDAELAAVKKQIADKEQQDEAARERARERQKAIQAEIATLKTALKTAEEERDGLKKELQVALAEIDRKTEENRKLRVAAVNFKHASNQNLWHAFTNNAKVRICDRGTHKRREACSEELDAWFTAEQHAAFETCVSTYQAMPMLWLAEDGQPVPSYAKRIVARDRERKDDWYVVYCDPTLPESGKTNDITEQTPQIFVAAAE